MRQTSLISTVLILLTTSAGCSVILPLGPEFTFGRGDAGLQDGATADAGEDASVLLDAAADGSIDAAWDAGPAPDVPTLRFPPNGFSTGSVHATDGPDSLDSRRPLFIWEPVSDVDRYEIAHSAECEAGTFRDCGFDVAESSSTTEVRWRPATALSVSTLPPVGTRYYWRVRACRGAICSSWSEVRYLDVGRQRGDTNGDGYADVVVGAPRATNSGRTDAGRVHVAYGPDFSIAEIAASGANSGDLFGSVIAQVGDVNADGFADIAVTSPGAAPGGRVYIMYGSADGLGGPSNIGGSSLNAEFGAAICGGDLDGDGFSDVLVGSPGADVGGGSSGSVFIFLGQALGIALTSSGQIDPPSPIPGLRFGAAVSCSGDIDGNGIVDVAIGVPGVNRALVYLGRPALLPGDSPAVFETPHTPPLFDSSSYGATLSLSGDFDADGFGDIIVGAPDEYTGSADEAGRIYAYRGARILPTTHVVEIAGFSEFGHLGAELSASGDITGDGLDDLLESRWGFAYDGSMSALIAVPHRSVPMGVMVDDVEGDGLADLAHGQADADSGRGQVIVALSSDSYATASLPAPTGSTRFGAAVGRY